MRTILGGLPLLMALASCASTPAAEDITGGTWTLIELFGEPVDAQDTARPVTLTLTDGNANGYSGCNQFTGPYTLSGNELRFGAIAMTRMACERGMDVETRFGSVFDRTRTWILQDGILHLIGTDGLLARFRR